MNSRMWLKSQFCHAYFEDFESDTLIWNTKSLSEVVLVLFLLTRRFVYGGLIHPIKNVVTTMIMLTLAKAQVGGTGKCFFWSLLKSLRISWIFSKLLRIFWHHVLKWYLCRPSLQAMFASCLCICFEEIFWCARESTPF